MNKSLVVAEKPSAAADYAKALNCIKKDGYYENDNYVITYALGHLFELKKPDEYDLKYKSWNMEDLPIVPDVFQLKLIDSTKSRYYQIKKLIDRDDVTEIINGGDCGTEGELIQREIYINSKTKKPIKRLWIDDPTVKEIKRGFQNLKNSSEYDGYYYAALIRQKIDWCMGMSYSRAFTIKCGNNTTLSVGRCQTPILNLIVKRDLEIEAFKSTPYYELIANLGLFNAKFIDLNSKDTKILNKILAEKLGNAIKNKQGKIVKVNRDLKTISPPKLFNLTDLQKVMSNKYSIPEDKTLKIAQKLYEEYKILSYPRTSSNYLTNNLAENFDLMLNTLKIGPFEKIINSIPESAIERAKSDKRFIDNSKVTDHYALSPTLEFNNSKYQSLSEDEKKVFDEVILRFLSIFFEDYKYESITILTNISGFAFITKGKIENSMGWKSIYNDDETDQDTADENNLGHINISVDDIINVNDVSIVSNKTKPPRYYTTSSILSLMQHYNIGTVATRADILETLLKRNFVNRDGKKFVSTQLGRDLINKINIEEIKSLELTAQLENSLNQILNNQVNYKDVFNNSIKILNDNIEKIKNSNITTIKKESYGKCLLCKSGDIISKKGIYGCTNYSKGCNFSIPKLLCETDISEIQVKKILLSGQSDILKFKGKKSTFKARLVYSSDENKIVFKYIQKK